jgi:uncharacterized protein YcfJ
MNSLRNSLLGAAALTVTMVFTTSADAKGCIKGAVVGGIAGHAVHHGLIGAAAGCIVGRHEANKKEKEEKEKELQNQPSGAVSAPDPGKYQ